MDKRDAIINAILIIAVQALILLHVFLAQCHG